MKKILIIFQLVLLCFLLSYSQDDILDGLVVYYSFEDSAKDASYNGHHAQIMSEPVFADDTMGKCIVLDGIDDYILSPAGIVNPGVDTFSIALWVYWDSDAISGQKTLIQQTSGGVSWLFTHKTGGDIRSYLAGQATSTDFVVPFKEWVHICLIGKAPNMISIYVNGNPKVLDHVLSSNMGSSSGQLEIGAQSTHNDRFWVGKLDEIAIFKRELSENDILQIFETGLPDIEQPENINEAETNNFSIINPVDDGIIRILSHVSNDQSIVKVINMTGQVVHQESFDSSDITLNTSLSPGYYVVAIESKNQISNHKIIIK